MEEKAEKMEFQFLIGKILTKRKGKETHSPAAVSIPYR